MPPQSAVSDSFLILGAVARQLKMWQVRSLLPLFVSGNCIRLLILFDVFSFLVTRKFWKDPVCFPLGSSRLSC